MTRTDIGCIILIVTIDIGNTSVVIGEWRNNNLTSTHRFDTSRFKSDTGSRTADNCIHELFASRKSHVEGVIISSVVSKITNCFVNALKNITGINPIVIDKKIKESLITTDYDCSALGSDRVVAAIAALSNYEKPIVIIDLGTATTISVIDSFGNFIGGSIFPGIRLCHDALIHNTELPPISEIDNVKSAIGKSTIECINSGIIFGIAGMIDSMADRIRHELNADPSVIITGGNAGIILPYLKVQAVYDPNLILDGLKLAYDKLKPQTEQQHHPGPAT
jgi:type III pantothenate kinase